MSISIGVYEADPHVPMLLGTLIAALVAAKIGFNWDEIQNGMIEGITFALQAVIILAIIGVLIGVWILGGIVPTIIYYGLEILSPSIFLFATVIITSITALATGTSWGTIGTMGIALMGIGVGFGIPAPMAAGAIISGSYFGDKLSPLSDTTNLAPAVSGTDIFTHIKHMFITTSISYVIVLGIFLFLGFQFNVDGTADLSTIDQIQQGLSRDFTISPILFLAPITVIVAIAKKVPAIPGITLGIILGMFLTVIFQPGINFGDILHAGYDGYVSETGVEEIDELLTTGGLTGMMYSISLAIIAMMFGGITEKTGQLKAIVNFILSKVKSEAGLMTTTAATGIFSNLVMPEQYISVVVPGRMYAPAYKEKNLHPKQLSRTLEAAGTLTAPLVPWNTCGVFIYGALGISAFEYLPYAFMNYLTIIIVLLFGVLGISTARLEE
ncbi:Na+/H+ antiporter NhaC [Natranaerobius trueperi]|uniref:Na+/H+ antiporter NhaC n=2 Tax=Natranaerobius trueperi TaxID=759412 RepID=A0A226C1K8_9FIRM|nr:Na+/H+ antiporter NhaC [Natranaerobius trueperi]